MPPPADDVLDNIGAEVSTEAALDALVDTTRKVQTWPAAPARRPPPQPKAATSATTRVDLRYRKRGRFPYPFTAKTSEAYAEEVRSLALQENVFVGELLEEMLEAWKAARRGKAVPGVI